MSHILQQQDNITILGDIYEYPTYNCAIEWEKEFSGNRKALLLQIIINVNGKQKIFRTNYELLENESELKDYEAWANIIDFIEAIWYEINFDMCDKLKEVLDDSCVTEETIK